MNFAIDCWASQPAWVPCDVSFTVDPVVAIAFAFAHVFIAASLFACIALVSREKR